MSKRIPEKDLTFRARKSDKVVFPIDKKNVSNTKMSKDREQELAKQLIDKYPKLKEEGLTTGKRLKLQGADRKRILEIIGKDRPIYEQMVEARKSRKGQPTEKKSAPKKKKTESEDEIVEILVKKYPALKKYVTGRRLMVRSDKAKEIRRILQTADDQKLYEEMIEERGKRRFQEGKGIRVPKKTDALDEEDRLGKAKAGSYRGRARKQSAPKKNAKTIPQRIARQELVSGKKLTPAKTTPGQAILRNPPPGMTKVPVGMMKRNIADSLKKGKFKVTKKVQPGKTYLKRNVRAGGPTLDRGAFMLYQS